jgi:hypothetical protein
VNVFFVDCLFGHRKPENSLKTILMLLKFACVFEFAEKFNIGLILRAIRRFFGCEEVRPAEAPDRSAGLGMSHLRATFRKIEGWRARDSEMKLNDTPARLIGLNEILPAWTERFEGHVQFFAEQSIEAVEVLQIARRNVEVPIHGESRHASQTHGLAADQEVAHAS